MDKEVTGSEAFLSEDSGPYQQKMNKQVTCEAVRAKVKQDTLVDQLSGTAVDFPSSGESFWCIVEVLLPHSSVSAMWYEEGVPDAHQNELSASIQFKTVITVVKQFRQVLLRFKRLSSMY